MDEKRAELFMKAWELLAQKSRLDPEEIDGVFHTSVINEAAFPIGESPIKKGVLP